MKVTAPFPYHGGKSMAADIIWARLGRLTHCIVPFAGSLGAFLAGPEHTAETVNGLDANLANFWRAVQACPDEVARYCDYPISEIDLHARHDWLIRTTDVRREQLLADPEWCDPKAAGWWVWGISQWVGGEWCKKNYKRRPKIHPGTTGQGVHSASRDVPALLDAIASRLRRVRIMCGDWRRCLTKAVMMPAHGHVGVLLDPPYDRTLRAHYLYATDRAGISEEVRAWALEHGDHPRVRIALCGLAGEHDELERSGWSVVGWKGRGSSPKAGTRGAENRTRERIWFSPACKAASLFEWGARQEEVTA